MGIYYGLWRRILFFSITYINVIFILFPQAQLLAPTTADYPEQLEKAIIYLIKAINMSKENSRYHFLVYNASVLYWQFCRPFLKPNYRQYLARSLHQVVKALDDIDDQVGVFF